MTLSSKMLLSSARSSLFPRGWNYSPIAGAEAGGGPGSHPGLHAPPPFCSEITCTLTWNRQIPRVDVNSTAVMSRNHEVASRQWVTQTSTQKLALCDLEIMRPTRSKAVCVRVRVCVFHHFRCHISFNLDFTCAFSSVTQRSQCCIIQSHVLSVCHQEGVRAGEKEQARQSLRPSLSLSLSLSFCLMHPRTQPLAASTFLLLPKGRTQALRRKLQLIQTARS